MSSVSVDILTRVNTPFIAGIAGYDVPEEGTQHVIVGATSDNDILTEVYWKPGQGVKQDVLLPHDGRSGTAFYSADDNTQHVILVSADGTLTDVHWQSGQGIRQERLTQLSSITSIFDISGLTGYYSAHDQKRHVIVATGDGTLTEVYW